jgi:hypothetical protein
MSAAKKKGFQPGTLGWVIVYHGFLANTGYQLSCYMV